MITIHDNWEEAFAPPSRADLEALLPAFLTASRWFGGKAKTIRSATLSDVLHVDMGKPSMMLCFVEVCYDEGGMDRYTVPITAAFETEADRIKRDHANAVIGALRVVLPQGIHAGVLYDAMWNEDCAYTLLTSMGRRGQVAGSSGALVGSATKIFDEAAVRPHTAPVSVMKAEQSNTSVKFGDRVIMKLYRRVEPGVNPELEIGRILTARGFRHSPSLVGALEYRHGRDEPTTLALAQTFVANQGNAWEYTLSQLSRYFEMVSSPDQNRIASEPPAVERPSLNAQAAATDASLGFVDAARLLGQRTGELHIVLGQSSADPAFAPEPCSASFLQSRGEAMQRSASDALALLRNRLPALAASNQELGQKVLAQERSILDRLGVMDREPITALRIRCHGDYHLGQVLYTGQDFAIIDYEGEPAKPLAERRAKHLPIVDLAGMIRSFHYAAHAALRQRRDHPAIARRSQNLAPEADQWYRSARAAFLNGYRAVAGEAPFASQSDFEFNLLLDVHVLDKALYELTYELNNRPDWVSLPLTGILHCVDTSTSGIPDVGTGRGDEACDPCAIGRPTDEVNQ
ncbi:MAG: Maltokinase [Nitrospira sp.]|jgi:trehalose synthase-fused probable maltokinase|nr:Maltokinase [Nitrospira sp.]